MQHILTVGGKRTLCGRNPDDWEQPYRSYTKRMLEVTESEFCKQCIRGLTRLKANTQEK